MLMHSLDDLGCRDRPGLRETLQKRCQAKEMIAVPVGDVNGGEVLAARDDPIQQSLRLLRREKGVHENGVALTPDEGRRIHHPHQFFLPGWQGANEARALYREYIPLKISFRVHCRVPLWLSDIRNIGVGRGGSVLGRNLGHASCAGIEQMLTKPFCGSSCRERKLADIRSEKSACYQMQLLRLKRSLE